MKRFTIVIIFFSVLFLSGCITSTEKMFDYSKINFLPCVSLKTGELFRIPAERLDKEESPEANCALRGGMFAREKTNQDEIEYQVFTKPYQGDTVLCHDSAQKAFYDGCLKTQNTRFCDDWWTQTEIYVGFDENNQKVCVFRVPKQLVYTIYPQQRRTE